jgi:NAD+ synthase
MSLVLSKPQHTFDQIVSFLQQTFKENNKQYGVIAVSGGIDSALSLSCLVKAIGKENVIALLLPYGKQSMDDARLITKFHQLPIEHVQEINIQPIVDVTAKQVGAGEEDTVRLGNLKARARMLCVFDLAKKWNALVCGTENKSEHYLGYFTRFGDAASDIEPISHLYKTQVRQLVQHLHLPEVFLEKAPSAGLWIGQTDEEEMGFTYEQADKVLEQFIDLKQPAKEITLTDVPAAVVQKVIQQVESMSFKLKVPYVV